MSNSSYKKAPGESALKAVPSTTPLRHTAMAHPLSKGRFSAEPPVPAGPGASLRRVRWGAAKLWEGESILLLAEVLPTAVPDGTAVKFRVFEAAAAGRGKEVKSLEAKAKAGLAKAEWIWAHAPATGGTDPKDNQKNGLP